VQWWTEEETLGLPYIEHPSSLRFTASMPGLDIINVGMTNAGRIQQNLAALAAGPLAEPLYESMRSRWRTVTRWRKILPGGHRGWHAWI
jgi:hypothetical protein